MNNELQIKLTDFEGPLDLLLHLIKSSEMDIYDIPIVTITEQYMDFLHQDKLALDIAGEYLVMAASLMKIKSRYLLPSRPTIDLETGDEIYEDPRQGLVDQLIEYRRYQEAAQTLRVREEARQQQFTRAPALMPTNLDVNIVAPGVDLDALQAAFNHMIKRQQIAKPVITTIHKEIYTIAEKRQSIKQRLKVSSAGIPFMELFTADSNMDEYVTTFLAILEMAKYHELLIHQLSMADELVIQPRIK
ncbi:segregation/condensation protein A [Periweissella fabaria]|uniref:Segregation and condensation protein A n=1 Tax=Periweissella fabaria TaxID=546157 RepID=A0ABM8Z437_9LACO|nr:segregation/condensation protein A [Periweissella fabaria]MCM0597414.1 segregation/condensation protein A [Periweissella fabaria]CAH0416081.1 Segregation and condensation protein A [Periweissella fabaria]